MADTTAGRQALAEAKRWLLEEHLPGGTIRWHCFEHKHQCRARAAMSEHGTTVTPLYADNPSPQTNMVSVPRDRLLKLLEYSDAEYVPNSIFTEFRGYLDTTSEGSDNG